MTRLTRFPLSSFKDQDVLQLIAGAIQGRDLAVLTEGEKADGEEGSTAEQRRLVRKIEAKTRGRLAYSGRQYKLVADVDLSRVPNRNSYEVVAHANAMEVLEGAAHQPGAGTEVAALLLKARDKLTRDWRLPLSPDGLILLRRSNSPQVSSAAPGVPLTPSQIKAMLKKSEWIEIEVVDDEDEPYVGSYRVELPDSSTTEGNFDAEGVWANYDIDEGNCKLTLVVSKPAMSAEPSPPDAQPPAPDADLAESSASPALSLIPGPAEPAVCPTAPDGVCSETPLSAHYLELVFVDDSGQPIVSRSFEVRFPDGSVLTGVSDETGLARIPNDAAPGSSTVKLLPRGG